jgi:ketosteroid isomerase-like protein
MILAKFFGESLARFAPVAALAAALLAQGCSQTSAPPIVQSSAAQTDTHAADEAAIRVQSAAWSDAAHSQDCEKEVSFYAADAVAFDDGGPIETGIETFRKSCAQDAASKNTSIAWKTAKVEVAKSGEMAYEYGHYHLEITGKDGKVTTQPGKYLLVWKKQADGAWKVAIDTDNSDVRRQP